MPLALRRSIPPRLLWAPLLCAALFAGTCAGAPDDTVATVVAAHPAPADAERYPVEALREDFDALYAGLKDAHYDLFIRRDRGDYDRRFERMRAALDRPLTPLQTRIAFQTFVAYGDVAHARIDTPMAEWERFRAGGGRAFPLWLRVEDGAAYVTGGTGGLDGIAPGDRLVSVDGLPAMEWLGRLRRYVSADTDYMAWAQMEQLLPLLAWEAFGEPTRYEAVIAKPDGRRLHRVLPARTRAEAEAAQADEPAAFELDMNTREARMLDGGIAYLRPGPFYDNRPDAPHPWDPTAFRRFIDDAFADFIEHDAGAVLIDLRDNPGGDNSFSDPMVAWFADRPFRFTRAFEIRVSAATVASNRRRLEAQGNDPDSVSARMAAAYADRTRGSIVRFPVDEVPPRAGTRFEGDVYVLVNRRSYSNTVLVAAIVQDFGFGTVLGEETSDLASTYGAMERFTLPGTGIEVGYPKARILRPNGDPQPRGVVPDIAIETPVVATRDVVLERALAHIADDDKGSR